MRPAFALALPLHPPVSGRPLTTTRRPHPVSYSSPRASLTSLAVALPLALAEEANGNVELYRRIFAGGMGIIASGIVGAFCVSFIVNANFDSVEKDFMYRDMDDEERENFERYGRIDVPKDGSEGDK